MSYKDRKAIDNNEKIKELNRKEFQLRDLVNYTASIMMELHKDLLAIYIPTIIKRNIITYVDVDQKNFIFDLLNVNIKSKQNEIKKHFEAQKQNLEQITKLVDEINFLSDEILKNKKIRKDEGKKSRKIESKSSSDSEFEEFIKLVLEAQALLDDNVMQKLFDGMDKVRELKNNKAKKSSSDWELIKKVLSTFFDK